MRTPRFTRQEVLDQFTHRPVLTKEQLLEACGCSPMTVWRLLSREGYFTSYNCNARYYTLVSIPEFDERGLWGYEGIRFSRWGSLPETLVGLVEHSTAGLTAHELAELLQVRNVRPALTQLADRQRLWREAETKPFVYLAAEPSQRDRQRQHRAQAFRRSAPLPEPTRLVALLVEIVRHPDQTPRQWARRLARRDIPLRTEQIRAVLDHYQLAPKKGLWNS
ncbi:MAG: hypothetical protein EHM23_00310 [Acidobacteria bacterium]|nr:MAG: hypothetical protein EHM23_32100 [Acidobacteriota bacterium]RPJ64053.1 MAG: hypothetical protein EHM23_01045 [Acidobacteriota bacterium]RPJ64548.1 MAG: hypothetical protein EHM23_00310 [Acidobacteriota bacterium]